MSGRRRITLLFALAMAACSAPGGPGSVPPLAKPPDGGTVTGSDGGALTPEPSFACLPPKSSEVYPARSNVLMIPGEEGDRVHAVASQRTVFVSDLFELIKTHCSACHVDNNLGGFHVAAASIIKDLDRTKLERVLRADDPAVYMPPPPTGKPFSQRAGNDPVLELLSLLEAWFDQGKPADVFFVAGTSTEAVPTYMLPEDTANQVTNLGTCVPQMGMRVPRNNRSEMEALDSRFAAMQRFEDLPDNLSETDLSTLDGTELARKGVFHYAPTYPLWSDDSGKIRAIRVPVGQSVTFDKATQRFRVPDNTRFYKTFLKKVIDRDGNVSFKKIETRLIVARNDTGEPSDGYRPNALFGTYAWNEDETEAVLVRDPLRNGQPFRDRLFTYIIDEPKAKAIIDSKPANLSFALEDENKGIVRRYAIPSSERCIECHMGSPSGDFVLGFTPLQIKRRRTGEGGTYEATGDDELDQLERLISYGVIAGVTAQDVVPLEESQAPRHARNSQELAAQAYLLGNCAHCHNPRGFPSVHARELRDVLDFLPSSAGGVFQFPLDRFSPLRKRGPNQDVRMPYITPSLRDYPVAAQATANWKPKFFYCDELPDLCTPNARQNYEFIAAPWRSLLYRNVETPSVYADDFAVFPHMPRNSAGYDCRAPHIMGDWMVSIPAVRPAGTIEDLVGDPSASRLIDASEQPYTEVKPGSPEYDRAAADAKARLDAFHAGAHYKRCPDTSDIVDHDVLHAKAITSAPVPVDETIYADAAKSKPTYPEDAVPEKPHWVVTDLTDTPGDWFPRRLDFEDVLVSPKPNPDPLVIDVPQLLSRVSITPELRSYALTDQPFGLWAAKPGCNFPGVKRVQDFSPAERPGWMDRAKAAADAPVFTARPGEAVFENICVNCHGPNADSHGVLADTIAEMTGGNARVANFRDGILGPGPSPGGNIQRVFGSLVAPTAGLTAEDWAGRYVAWMGLGGTRVKIPQPVLSIVGTTPVVGHMRNGDRFQVAGSANMLQLASTLCAQVILADDKLTIGNNRKLDALIDTGRLPWNDTTGLIDTNGDAEMWMHLCAMGNRPLVVAVSLGEPGTGANFPIDIVNSYYGGEGFVTASSPPAPADAGFMSDRGEVASTVFTGSSMNICIKRPPDAGMAAEVEQKRKQHQFAKARNLVPYCPEALFAKGADGKEKYKFRMVYDEVAQRNRFVDTETWAARGAINAGLAAFLYLEQVSNGTLKPRPRFNECERLEQ